MSNAGEGGLLTLPQAAARLGVSVHTVRRWVKAGKLAAEKHAGPRGAQYMVPAAAVETAHQLVPVVQAQQPVDVATLAGVLEAHLHTTEIAAELVALRRLAEQQAADLAALRAEIAEQRQREASAPQQQEPPERRRRWWPWW